MKAPTHRARSVPEPLAWGPTSLRASLWALLALSLGALVYATDRDPERVALMASAWSLPQWGGWLPRPISDSLPSFVHVFAFSVLTVLAWARTRRQACGVVVAWWLLDSVFELAQHPAVRVLIDDYAVLRPWPAGEFGGADLLALLLGALAAAAWVCQRRLFQRGEQA